MAVSPQRKLTYDDVAAFPDDGLRRELIDGEVYVVASPNTRHQVVVVRLTLTVGNHVERYGGGHLFVAPYDVVFSPPNFVEPDLVFVADGRLDAITEANIQGAPSWIIEVVSDRVRDFEQKLRLYERFGVPEYWIVDPLDDLFYVYRLAGAAYGEPRVFTPGDTVSPLAPPALSIDVAAILRR